MSNPLPPSKPQINQQLASTSFDPNELNKYTQALKGEVALKPMSSTPQAIGGSQDHPTPQRKPAVPGSAQEDQNNTRSALANYDQVKGVVGEEDFKRGGIIPRKKLADGGVADQFHSSGLFNSAGAGRTDILNRGVPAGGYVVPADVVSGLGEGNTLAGAGVIERMFGTGNHSVANAQKVGQTKNFAKGGTTKSVPVKTAGGEYFLHPADLIRKFGDLKRAHTILDKWVVSERAKHIKTLKNLPGPKK